MAYSSKQLEYMNLYQAGFTISQIAEHCGVNKSTVSRVLTRARKLTCMFASNCDSCPLPECALKPEYAVLVNNNGIKPLRRGRHPKEVQVNTDQISPIIPEKVNTSDNTPAKETSNTNPPPRRETNTLKQKVTYLPPVKRPPDKPKRPPTLRKPPEDPSRIKLGATKEFKHPTFMMTDGEIRTSFRQARDQMAQIEILAQLNGTNEHTIKKILGLE